jgi:hypothetical protein
MAQTYEGDAQRAYLNGLAHTWAGAILHGDAASAKANADAVKAEGGDLAELVASIPMDDEHRAKVDAALKPKARTGAKTAAKAKPENAARDPKAEG